MKKLKLSLLLFAGTLFSLNISAQYDSEEPDRRTCGAAEVNNEALLNNPDLIQLEKERNQWALDYTAKHYGEESPEAISYTIPVVYHIIHNDGPENISKATVMASMKNLNDDFQKLNADISQVVSAFTGIAADCEIQFRLAHIDHLGNCTEGITRTRSTQTYSAGNGVKSLVNWNTSAGKQKYLQIWVVQAVGSGAGGYSYLPGNTNNAGEGIVVRNAQLMNTITHEVGHYLNLNHPWGPSNNPGGANNCNSDDNVTDTPNTVGNTSCNTSAVSCGSLDNVQNYMDYSFCERMFTKGQKSRVHAALNSSTGTRNNLHTAANLAATGTADPYGPVVCTPTAGFIYDKEYICEGASVQFTDDSYNATPTGWNWTFTGGTPSTSNVANPSIVYNTAGVYSVTHEPSTSAGSGTVTKNSIITVSSLVADYVGPIIEGFENTTAFATDWRIENPEGQAWQSVNTAAATGSRSILLRNYYTANDGEKDGAISPAYDISSIGNPSMKFKVAFAKKATNNTDKLLVYTSTNCGATWSLKLPLGTVNLTTAPNQTSQFTPTASEWVEKTVSLTNITGASKNNVRFKFEFTSGGGNNIYIDDINIGGEVGLNEFANIASFTVYPNPTSSSAQITFNLVKNVDVLSIKVRNAVGQEVTDVINGQSFASGDYTLNIDNERKLSSGIYFIEFKADGFVKTEKLIVQ